MGWKGGCRGYANSSRGRGYYNVKNKKEVRERIEKAMGRGSLWRNERGLDEGRKVWYSGKELEGKKWEREEKAGY
jgi:hypothetical protein